MEPSTTQPARACNSTGLRFILLGLLALGGSLVFGAVAALQFLNPDFLDVLSFRQTRPLHVSLALAWIFATAIGGIYYYLPKFCRLNLYSDRAARLHLWIFLGTGMAILAAYFAGKFGGREYWEFPVLFSLPIFLSWILFGVNYFKTVTRRRGPWPVYFWMWGTGIVFFFITFSETYLWLFPFFRDSMVRELTVQWKAYGALIGSWNMLVYGTAIFVMTKISGDDKLSRSKLAFGLYFLGLFNLMFGWAHHAYPVPSAPWIRNFAYLVSMTELFILGKIIWDWRRSVKTYRRHQHRYSYQFLYASDMWIFLNLVLALIMSVPAANLFTHGTHVTVAHAMGTTIGINTMILLASVFFIIEDRLGVNFAKTHATAVRTGFWLGNFSLAVFWTALIAAGLARGTYTGDSFQEMMQIVRPYLMLFAASGIGLLIGLLLVIAPAVHLLSGRR